jgi:hypothetical protein
MMATMMMSWSALETADNGCYQRWRRLTMATMMMLLSALEAPVDGNDDDDVVSAGGGGGWQR